MILPYWDLSLRIHHSTWILCQYCRSGGSTNGATHDAGTHSSPHSSVSICATPQFPRCGLSLGRHSPSSWHSHRRLEACRPQRNASVFLQSPQRPQQGISQWRGKSLFSLLKCKNSVKIGCQPSLHKSNVQTHSKGSASQGDCFLYVSWANRFVEETMFYSRGTNTEN